MASAVHPPPPTSSLALLPRPRVVDVDMEYSDTESVAESCPHPRPHGAATDSCSSSFSCGSSACCHEDDEAEMFDDDDDGCSSCVEGDEWSSYHEQDEAAGDEEEEEGRNKAGPGTGAWWEHMAVAGARGGAIAALPLPAAQEATEDPKRAAERQEEDRKFWEDCLASGYP